MTRNPRENFGIDLSLDEIRAQGVAPEDIDSDWMDEMVKRLFRELKRQLSQIEAAKPGGDRADAAKRAADIRALSGIERTLERLVRMEQQRALVRETKIAANNDERRAALIRRLDQLLPAGAAPRVPDGDQQ
jgi:hypothetical protein